MRHYWTVAVYGCNEDNEKVYDKSIITAKNDLDAVKQVIAHSDAEEVMVWPRYGLT